LEAHIRKRGEFRKVFLTHEKERLIKRPRRDQGETKERPRRDQGETKERLGVRNQRETKIIYFYFRRQKGEIK